MEGHELEREAGRHPVGAFIQVMALKGCDMFKGKEATVPKLQELLDSFTDIFQEPTGLPPNRVQDHCIPLQTGNHQVCSKPYRYPNYQKAEIVRLVSDMVSTGVICPSNNPFSSPVVLVKKQDGTWRMYVDYRSLNQITIKDKFSMQVFLEPSFFQRKLKLERR